MNLFATQIKRENPRRGFSLILRSNIIKIKFQRTRAPFRQPLRSHFVRSGCHLPPRGGSGYFLPPRQGMMHFKARPLGELSAELTERGKNNKILYFPAPPCHPERSRNPSETRIERCFHRSGSRRKSTMFTPFYGRFSKKASSPHKKPSKIKTKSPARSKK